MADRPYRSPPTERAPGRSRSRSRSPARSRDRDRPPRSNKDSIVSRRRSYSRSRSRSPPRSPVRRHRSRSRDKSRTRHGHHDRNTPLRRSPSPHRRKSRSKSPDRKQRRRSYPRSRSRSVSPNRGKQKRRRSRSISSSGSDSPDDRERRRKRKEKSRKRSRSRDRKERKKDKKKDKKKKKTGAVTSQYGKYGIIDESDQYNKAEEFRAWLVEERKINPETQSHDNVKREFAQFMEDYNTATLPHEKYYSMASYERRMNALRHGELLPAGDELTYDANADLKAHTSAHKRKVIEQESYLSKERLMELRKVQNERVEAGKMKLLGMDLPQNLGVRMDGTAFDD